MGDVKMHYNRLRLDVRYPGKPNRGQPEPLPGALVHWLTPALTSPCRTPSVGQRLRTQVLEKVTCPACLKILNLSAHPKQPPCESPAGATGLSADPAGCAAKKPSDSIQSSFGGSPVSASCPDTGFFIAG